MAKQTYGGWDSQVKTRQYLYGLADVRLDRKGNATIKLFKDPEAKPPRLNDQTFEIAADDIKTSNPIRAGQWFVCVSEAGDRLVSFSPPKGQRYTFRFHSFPHAADSLPEPRLNAGGPRTWKDKKTGQTKKAVFEDSLDFSFVAEVVDGPYAGSTARMTVPYAFAVNEQTGFARLAGSQSQVERLGTFLTVLGATEPLPFSDNLLPDLEGVLKELADSGHIFSAKCNAGRLSDLEPLESSPKKTKKAKAK